MVEKATIAETTPTAMIALATSVSSAAMSTAAHTAAATPPVVPSRAMVRVTGRGMAIASRINSQGPCEDRHDGAERIVGVMLSASPSSSRR